MITITCGDILQAHTEALVNTVNCVGIMGRGIALQFKKAFPANFTYYKAACDNNKVHPGEMLVYDLNRYENPRYVINFPTKRHWKNKSRLEDIATGLDALGDVVRKYEIHSIAIPPLGSGLGGLNWNDVRPMIEKTFREFSDVEVLLYEPKGAPKPEKMAKERNAPNMTIGRASLLVLIRQYLSAVMDPSISLLEIHKLMLFMQDAGENLRLQYKEAPYGPYAANLRHVLNRIEGHFISGYGDGKDDPDVQIALIPEAVENAESFLRKHPDTQARFQRVSQLINGFETPYGMELLATVYWVATRKNADTAERAIQKVYAWNSRKKMFRENHIRIAWQNLLSQKWIQENKEKI